MAFKKVDTREKLPKLEEKTIKFWQENKIFEKSVEKDAPNGDYVFYDGPPFITGLPHYATLLPSIAKDLIPRYWTMKGYRVERVWGWDCHGLPAENKVESELGLKNKKDIEILGVGKFVDACRDYVKTGSEQWEWYINRIGRWVDMKNAYKTMDTAFMESVIWAFKELYDKGLIYEGHRSSLHCPRCATPLSKFEVTMDEGFYKDVTEKSVAVKFGLKEEPGTSLLAWTTTPWTLPGNLALAVSEDVDYIKAKVQKLEIELEKGWLVKELPKDLRKHKTVAITQAYLENYTDDSGRKVKDARVRKTGDNFEFTVKYFAGDEKETGQLIEKNKKITKEAYVELIKQATKKITKERIYYPLENGLVAEVDIYQNNLQGLVVTEVEFPSIKKEQEFKKPDWLGKEVTDSDGIYPPVIAEMNLEEVEKINEEYEQESHNYEDSVQNEIVVLAKNRLEEILEDMEYEILEEVKGKDLVGLSYEPLFDLKNKEISKNKNTYKVCAADFVTTEDGTGIVHIAPNFGEDDFNLGKEHSLPVVDLMDENGHYTKNAGPDWDGLYFKKAGKKVLEKLDDKLFSDFDFTHSYPFCYRCSTSLIYKTQKAWYLKIDEIREKMIKNNENINWVPEHFKDGRFKYNLENAPDWCLSRSRYWGSPVPVWKCEDESCGEMKVIGSIEKLEKLSGKKIKDLHRPEIDEIEFDCEKCNKQMKRVVEVIDCWFESGAMPFSQFHYPFENKNEKTGEPNMFPADFIVEYTGQLRGWFYCLHVLATALFDSPAFKNVITTGVLAGTDGRKMSKSYGNYPDPRETLEKYGSDALRFYFMESPIMLSMDMNMSEDDLAQINRGMMRTIWNSYSFFVLYANIDNWKPVSLSSDRASQLKPSNQLDKWILSELNILNRDVTKHIEDYEIPKAVRLFPKFVDNLSNWYIRRSRRRFWKSESDTDKNEAYRTLHHVLVEFSKIFAPVCPFVTEEIYKNLTGEESVHLAKFPEVDKSLINEELSQKMEMVRDVINQGLAIRAQEGIKVRQPLEDGFFGRPYKDLLLKDKDHLKFIQMIKEELNINGFQLDTSLDSSEIKLNTKITPELKLEGQMRELVRKIQSARKEAGFDVENKINLWHKSGDEIFDEHQDAIATEILAESIKKAGDNIPKEAFNKKVSVDDQEIEFWIAKT